MRKTIGRPMKYRHILAALNQEALYSPATIARFAQERGFLDVIDNKEERFRIYQRIRITMGRFSNNHHFPREGDGQIKLDGQPFIPGWFGWRWQEAAGLESSELRDIPTWHEGEKFH